ncbi:MAG: dihydrofolate reductase [Alphaproteobacteria bacterium]|nr:dihydrofolate reductase [Alphaproteobacteria bacterium]
MSKPRIVLVVARADNGVIGRDGKLPWHLPADLKRVKRLTLGKPMIMGRRTFESLPGLLPGRRHIVLTRDPNWYAEGAEVAQTIEEALSLAETDEISVIGGVDVFRLFLPLADVVELTEVHGEVGGDTVMPPFPPDQWRESWREDHPAEDGRFAYSFVTLTRRG